MRAEKGAWRGAAALALAGVYAMAADTLMSELGPGRFMAVSAGVLAVMWLLGTTAPHTVRYVAPPEKPVDPDERVDAREAMWIAAVVLVTAAVALAVLPCLLR